MKISGKHDITQEMSSNKMKPYQKAPDIKSKRFQTRGKGESKLTQQMESNSM
jgi:hypothetical protein